MAEEILIFDAAGSNIDGTDPGSPLTVHPGTSGYKLFECSYPAPPQNVQYASSVDTEGDIPVSARYGNRTITLKFKLIESAGTLLAALQAKYAKLQREGGTLKRTMKNGDVRIYDILAGDGWDPTYDFAYYIANLTIVEMVLPARPFSRGAEVDLGDNTTTTLPWLVFTEATVTGDAPALGRLVIDNDEAATTMWHVAWAIQQKNYSAASTAALYYEAESCAMLGSTAVAGPAGASGGGSNVARHTSLGLTATDLFYIGASSTAQTHAGSFRVFARVYAPNTNTGTVSVGVKWGPQVQRLPKTNTLVPLVTGALDTPVEQQWAVMDLGIVSPTKARKGSQGWLGNIVALSTVSGDDLDVDWVALLPVDESYGEAYGLAASALALVGATGKSVEVRHDGVIRQDAAAAYWIEPDVFEGDHLLIPPSGAEARTLRVICRFSRHIPLSADRSLASVNADVVGDVSANLFVTPRYLT